MQRILAKAMAHLLLSVVAVLVATSGASRQSVTPIQKVVQMLAGMLAKGKKEMHEEQVMYAAYKQFCDDTTTEKTNAVQEASDQIDLLKADIQLAGTTAEELQRKMQELDNDVATWQADVKAATHVREIEHADYLVLHKDYTESVDAIAQATQVIKAQAFKRPQAALLEKRLRRLTTVDKLKDARRVVDAFLASEEEPALPSGTPEVAGYEFQSSGIIDMLDKLHDKFLDERTAIENEETNQRHAHELLVQDLTKSIKAAGDTRTLKVQQRAKELQSSATMTGELTDTTSSKAEDQKYLSDMTATCGQKASGFTERQKLRTDELSALEKAGEILSAGGVKDASMLLQSIKAPAFVQKTNSNEHSPELLRVASYLNERAGKLHSQVLFALAVRARDDPFLKVKKMIQGLIVRLMEEAGDEAQHKGWCDTELAENSAVRTSRSSQTETLASEIDQKRAYISKAGTEITELTQDVANTEAEIAESTKLRNEEKAKNDATVSDSQQAQAAVQQAIIVLREFYGKAAESTAFVQSSQAPAIFDAPYTGMGAESGGVIGMLEVIESDFGRLESETAAMEATSQREYDKFMSDAAVTKAQAQKDIEHKTHTRQTNEQALLDLGNDLSSAQKELDAANKYYEKLKPSCLDAGMSSEERSTRRQEEIQSLQEALRILNGEDIA